MKKYIFFLFVIVILSACNEKPKYEEVEIIGPSMEPTCKDGQILKVDADYYNRNAIERNDIVYFYKDQKDKCYVKRIIGLPNEEIKVMKDKILIDGIQLELPYRLTDNPNVGDYSTGANEYFVIGDNYGNSLDSRMFGAISKEQIIGKLVE
ncbi:signal peptidase I [Paenibacillus pedocola]|uniref:signal peptidase I n=1 Tax=Paenibacillus pedocola TaxID=3242193 RepID=UPI002877CB9B|nr:signal peptidase I [Paenibacillus typhae]